MLGVNDLHGYLERTGESPGAAYLAAHLDRYERANTSRIHAGDMVGASPLVSAYFHDEPTVLAMNEMGFDVGTIGNHEFDEGREEMQRLIRGGQGEGGEETSGPDFPGATFPYVAANTLDPETGEPVLPPYTVVERGGVKVAFIGVTTLETLEIIIPDAAEEFRFADISERRVAGKPVVQAEQYGTHFAIVDLSVDRASGEVTGSEAKIVSARKKTRPDPEVTDLVEGYAKKLAPISDRVVGTAGDPLRPRPDASSGAPRHLSHPPRGHKHRPGRELHRRRQRLSRRRRRQVRGLSSPKTSSNSMSSAGSSRSPRRPSSTPRTYKFAFSSPLAPPSTRGIVPPALLAPGASAYHVCVRPIGDADRPAAPC